jgi:hypothetical protein
MGGEYTQKSKTERARKREREREREIKMGVYAEAALARTAVGQVRAGLGPERPPRRFDQRLQAAALAVGPGANRLAPAGFGEPRGRLFEHFHHGERRVDLAQQRHVPRRRERER